jgi:hypothetical protein
MSSDRLKELFARVEQWPERRQQDVAQVLMEMEAQDRADYGLSADQVAEVNRRRNDRNQKLVGLTTLRKRVNRRRP